MQELIDKKIFNLIRVCMCVAAIPFIFLLFTKGIDLNSMSGLAVFWVIDCSPLYCLWDIFYKPKRISDINDPRLTGFNLALIGYIIIHLVFYVAVFDALKNGGQGASTTVIVFIFLPFISAIVMTIAFYIGYILKKIVQIMKGT